MAKNIRRKFGRIYVPDARDSEFPAAPVISKRRGVARNHRFWYPRAWVGDQGNKPHCVGYAWAHWLESGPVKQVRDKPPVIDPGHIYYKAQKVDQWEGEDYGGTSVRAGAKVLQTLGFVESYHWAEGIDDIVQALLHVGPVVLGTVWYAGMDRPGNDYYLDIKGSPLGGHAYISNGIDTRSGEEYVRIKNSWNKRWGKNGHARIKIADLEKLLKQEGEACIAIENN